MPTPLHLTKPIFPFLLVLECIRHLFKEIAHHFLSALTCGIDQKESEYVCLQPVHSGQGIMRQATEETLVQVHPESLQACKVRASDTLYNVVHYSIHLHKGSNTMTGCQPASKLASSSHPKPFILIILLLQFKLFESTCETSVDQVFPYCFIQSTSSRSHDALQTELAANLL